MCTEVEIKRKGLRSIYIRTVRDLARHLSVIVPADKTTGRINRMATHCLCPVDVNASAEASGYRVVAEPMFCPDIIIEKVEWL